MNGKLYDPVGFAAKNQLLNISKSVNFPNVLEDDVIVTVIKTAVVLFDAFACRSMIRSEFWKHVSHYRILNMFKGNELLLFICLVL
jgi:hypothetical protein